MEIVQLSVRDIHEYPGNPRKNDDAVRKVAASIHDFGFINPIAVTPDHTIISGHTRYRAALSLGLETVPCIVHDLSEEDARLARILDNKTSEYATWDIQKLNIELERFGSDDHRFFKANTDLKSRMSDLKLSWGKVSVPATEEEHRRFKERFDSYVKENKSYLGFVTSLLGDRVHV